jgi:hypothetical protein
LSKGRTNLQQQQQQQQSKMYARRALQALAGKNTFISLHIQILFNNENGRFD